MVELSGNRLIVRSALRMADADAVCRAGEQALSTVVSPAGSPRAASGTSGSTVVVDLSGVAGVDSSALSVLLHWTRRVQASGHGLTVESAPAELISLARLYGVADTFGLA